MEKKIAESCEFCYHHGRLATTAVPTKNDSDVIFCLQLLSITYNMYNSLELTRIDRSLVY